jgi:hypothetical protein
MAQVFFTEQSIHDHLKRRLGVVPTHPEVPDLQYTDLESLADNIGVNSTVENEFDWAKIKYYKEPQQWEFWVARELIFAKVLLYILRAVGAGTIKRPPPNGFNLDDYTLNMFGSSKPTSDIDVSVEGPRASYLIAILEDTWLELTGQATRRWDVEFYGDFLMLYEDTPKETFLNSRNFSGAAEKILPYVGASILRNTPSLNFPLLDNFIANSDVAILKTDNWKAAAETLMKEVNSLDYAAARETYYKYLGDAEDLKASPLKSGETDEQRHLAVFLSLAHANLFRAENYVLPSTVIHIVRDIQAKSPTPQDDQCLPYHVKLASCALGEFTYLCSALEQIGYMQRFAGDPAKVAKYKDRLDVAMDRYEAAKKKGGRRMRIRRRTIRRRATPMRRRRGNKKSTRGRRALIL